MQNASSGSDIGSSPTREEDGQLSQSNDGSTPSFRSIPDSSRHWRDVFWLCIFVIHLVGLGFLLAVLGVSRFKRPDRLQIDKFVNKIVQNKSGQTETFWPLYAVAAAIGTVLGCAWLSLLGTRAHQMMKFSVYSLTTYLAVISVLCFWDDEIFWGISFAIGALLHFTYVMSVMDRFPFTMLVLQKAVKMVWNLPEVMRVAYVFMVLMLLWLALWTFGVAGVVASSTGDAGHWWLLGILSVSLFWTGAVLCNMLHVVVSGMVFHVLIHGGEGLPLPSNPLVRSLRHAATTSLGSICYGSLFTAAIRTIRWEIRGIRSKIGNNECLLCCVDFLFNLVETLVRFFNKYAYVQATVHGKSFNRSARDAWELFQSTGIEALIAYDCSGAVLLMGTILGGLIAGTAAGTWTWFKRRDRVVMVGFTSMLMGMTLVGLAMVVVESAVTSIYICYAEDPALINAWDAEFFDQMAEALHQRLQYRSARAREVINRRVDTDIQESVQE
ncbi:uncharacterized protein LOC116263162 [Nymphaea colorata]|nr:uncharacterized protein LOC116263162 [Nymphaea colorata]